MFCLLLSLIQHQNNTQKPTTPHLLYSKFMNKPILKNKKELAFYTFETASLYWKLPGRKSEQLSDEIQMLLATQIIKGD